MGLWSTAAFRCEDFGMHCIQCRRLSVLRTFSESKHQNESLLRLSLSRHYISTFLLSILLWKNMNVDIFVVVVVIGCLFTDISYFTAVSQGKNPEVNAE